MKVLIACEESQTVCKAFRALGHEAYSCDVQEPSGGPRSGIFGGCAGGRQRRRDRHHGRTAARHMQVGTADRTSALYLLTSCSAVWLFNADHTVKDLARERKGWEAKEFFLALLRCGVERIAVEIPHRCGILDCRDMTRSSSPICSGIPGGSERVCG